MVDAVTGLLGRKRVAVMVVDAHVETAGAFGNDLPNPAHAQDAQPFPGRLATDHEIGRPVAPFLAAHQSFTLAGASSGAKHQQDGNFRRGIGEHVGRVGDDNAPGGCRLEIDVIDTH